MGPLLSYSLYAGTFLILGYATYRALLAGQKQAALNRAALLALYAVSLAALPLATLLGAAHHAPDGGAAFIGRLAVIDATAAVNAAESHFDTARTILWIYAAGTALVAAWTLAGIIRLIALVARGRRFQRPGYTLVLLPGSIVPFSFMRYIVMGEADAAHGAGLVTAHELAHLRARHWLDLLAAQAVCAIMWYNPASWLMRRELRNVHEYQADNSVLAGGADTRSYQMLLIEKAAGVRLQSLANSLDHSNLSKRITMMYKQNRRASRLRVLALLPALLVAAAAVNNSAVASALDRVSAASMKVPAQQKAAPDTKAYTTSLSKDTEKTESTQAPATLPQFPGGMDALTDFLVKELRYPEAAAKAGTQGRVVVTFKIMPDGSTAHPQVQKSVSPELDADALRIVGAMPRWTPGLDKDGHPVECSFALPVQFALPGGVKQAKSDETIVISLKAAGDTNPSGTTPAPTYFVNGKIFEGDINSISPDAIKSINVRKDHPDYPNGVIEITLN